jgi:peptide/nickel transport system permease protein
VVAYLVKRLVWAVVLMVIISFFTFVLFFVAPGDVPLGRQGSRGTTNIATQFQFKRQPLPEAYVHWVWGVVRHGELGHSFADGQPVSLKLRETVPVTASLLLGGTLLFVLVGFSVGILSALHPRSLLDRSTMIFVLVGVSAHPVSMGFVLSYVFGVKLQVLPIAGYCYLKNPQHGCDGAGKWAYHLILPWITFAFLFAALYARMIRASVLETMNEDYVRTAVAKGASSARILRSHVLRNALLPVVTMLGMDVALAFAGSIFIETVYGLPGVGQMMSNALGRRDMPVIMGVVLLVSLVVVVANTVVDIAYAFIDPRVLPAGHHRPQRRRKWEARESLQPAVKVTQSPTT